MKALTPEASASAISPLALVGSNTPNNQRLSASAVKLKTRKRLVDLLGFLDKIEKAIEGAVTGAFSKTFKSELQPIEIGSAIKSHMDANAHIVSRDRILVPNQFEITLSVSDFARLKLIAERLNTELRNQAQAHAVKQGYQFAGPLVISLEESSSIGIGQVYVKASSPDVSPSDVQWAPRLEVVGEGLSFEIVNTRTSVGRDASSDIQINDTSLSRKHFEIIWDGKQAGIRDLGSTNGTFVGDARVREQALPTDSVIRAGHKTFVFRVIAKAVSS